MNELPRNMRLKAFDPHRKDFICNHEADVVPPINPEAEKWLQEGMALTSRLLWPDQRDYKKAAELWTKAAERKHWKAMLNLASLYANGEGVPRDTEHAVQIVEYAMKLQIPGAYDLMGTFHMDGIGVSRDTSRAYAFWELAADLGSPSAQAHIGKAISGTYDDPVTGFWGNRRIAIKMMDCGFAQGNGDAAYALGVLRKGSIDRDYARALQVLHDGVKFGSANCANYLFAVFDNGEPMVTGMVDPSRSRRYSVLGDALERNPDLRLPNLDKILPLPPAPLPKWDGKPETLIDAAKPLVPATVKAPTPGASRVGRAHIPSGWVLPQEPVAPPIEGRYQFPQYESSAARYTGYWLPQLLDVRTQRHLDWNRSRVPLRYASGESFDSHRDQLIPADGRIMWHYLGVLEQAPQEQIDPRVRQGIARFTHIPEPRLFCAGNLVCPRTGIWFASLADDHPLASTFNRWNRQRYVERGAAFATPEAEQMQVIHRDVSWLWLDNANQVGASGYADITLNDLNGSPGGT